MGISAKLTVISRSDEVTVGLDANAFVSLLAKNGYQRVGPVVSNHANAYEFAQCAFDGNVTLRVQVAPNLTQPGTHFTMAVETACLIPSDIESINGDLAAFEAVVEARNLVTLAEAELQSRNSQQSPHELEP